MTKTNDMIFAIPRAGLDVPDPAADGESLPPEGKWVRRSIYWVRRKREGDCTIDESRNFAKAVAGGGKTAPADATPPAQQPEPTAKPTPKNGKKGDA